MSEFRKVDIVSDEEGNLWITRNGGVSFKEMSSAGGGSGSVLSATKVVSSEELLAYDPNDNSTWPVLIDSPDGNACLIPVAGTWVKTNGSTGYSCNSSTQLGVGPTFGFPIFALTSGGSLGLANFFPTLIGDQYNYLATFKVDPDAYPGGTDPADLKGKNLCLVLDNPLTDGDFDLILTVLYYVVTVL